jgi:hypothetical protein
MQSGVVVVWTTDPGEAFNSLMRLGKELDLIFGNVTVSEPILEQAFISLVRREDGK